MTNSRQITIKVKDSEIQYANEYIYLDKQIAFNKTNNEEEIERRVNITWKKFWALKEILKGDYSLRMKKIIFETCLLPCLLYGCQTWVFTNKTKSKIRSTQRAMERSIMKIRKVQKINSSLIRHKTKQTDALRQALKLKWNWAGHIARLKDNRWTIKTTQWKGPLGKRNVGRPNKRWTDDIIQTAGKEWMKAAADRKSWKKMGETFTQTGIHLSN